MKCKVCGYEYENTKLFCPMCGTEREDLLAGAEMEFNWNTKDFPKPTKELAEMNARWTSPDVTEGYVAMPHAEEEKRPEKFYTFQAKNEEFQKLLDQEFERLKKIQQESGRTEAKASYSAMFEPKVAASVEEPTDADVIPQLQSVEELAAAEAMKAASSVLEAAAKKESLGTESARDQAADENKPKKVDGLVEEPTLWPVFESSNTFGSKPLDPARNTLPAEGGVGPKKMDNEAFDRMIFKDTEDADSVPMPAAPDLDMEPAAPEVSAAADSFDIKVLEYSIKQIQAEEETARKESEARRRKLEAMAAARDAYFKILDEFEEEKPQRGFGFRRDKSAPKFAANGVPKIEVPLETPVVITPMKPEDMDFAPAYKEDDLEAEAPAVEEAPAAKIEETMAVPKAELEPAAEEPVKEAAPKAAEPSEGSFRLEDIIAPLTEMPEHTAQFNKAEFREAQRKLEEAYAFLENAKKNVEAGSADVSDATPLFFDEDFFGAKLEDTDKENAAEEAKAPEADAKAPEQDVFLWRAPALPEAEQKAEDIQELKPEADSANVLPEEPAKEAAEEAPAHKADALAMDEREKFLAELSKVFGEDDFLVKHARESAAAKEAAEASEEIPAAAEVLSEAAAVSKEPVSERPRIVVDATEESIEAAFDNLKAETMETAAQIKAVEVVEAPAEIKTEEPVEAPAEIKTEEFEEAPAEIKAAEEPEVVTATENEAAEEPAEVSGAEPELAETPAEDAEEVPTAVNEAEEGPDTTSLEAIFKEYDVPEDRSNAEDTKPSDMSVFKSLEDEEEDDIEDDKDRPKRKHGFLRFLLLVFLIICLVQLVVFALGKFLPDVEFVKDVMSIAEAVQDAVDHGIFTVIETVKGLFK